MQVKASLSKFWMKKERKMKKTSRSDFKRLFLCFLVLYLVTTFVPPILYRAIPGPAAPGPEASPSPEGTPSPAPEATAAPSPSALPGPLDTAAEPEDPGFTLYDTAAGESFQVSAREFLAADLACEMDLHAPEEALKAQVVAAYTYYSRMRETGQDIPCDRGSWLVYASPEQMQERWGEDYEEYKAVLDRVVEEVYGQTLTYKGELILASYFAISPGSTENVENVWAEDANIEHPYLQAVASPGDAFSDGYLSYGEFTADELAAAFPGAELSGGPEGWVTEPEYTPSGMVKSVKVGGVTVSGTDVRTALGLRSACFECSASGDSLRFTVRGWGHGVGMSQAGAVFMAKRGAGYEEILGHYYPGAELEGA